jgi:hypothetical protein
MKALVWTVAFVVVFFVGIYAGHALSKPRKGATVNECIGRIIASDSNKTSYELCQDLSLEQQDEAMSKLAAYLRRSI